MPARLSRSRAVWVSSLLVAMVAVPLAVASAATITVDETDVGVTWFFFNETGAPTGGFELGPGVPPLGAGSVAFHTTAGADGRLLATPLYNGLRLDALTALEYYTYQNMTPQAVSFQIGVDYDDTDGSVAFQGRLVYEPYFTETVMTSVWQQWNMMAAGGTGNWWGTSASPIVGGVGTAQLCTQGNPCSWVELLGNYPNARVHPSSGLGFIGLKSGSGWPAGHDGYADALRVATNAADDTFDYETTIPVEMSKFTIE
jgi:hypothetical protein